MRFGLTSAAALMGVILLSLEATAQSFGRCENDAITTWDAEARVEWARRCALQVNVGDPNRGFTVWMGTTSLTDYMESTSYGQNSYLGDIMGYEVNSTYIFSLFNSSASSQSMDPYGYWKWNWPSTGKRAFPYYPVFGSSGSASDAGNVPLYPHPQLADCNLYTDRSAYNRASTFYVNFYCNATQAALTNGTYVMNLADSTGGEKYFTVTVPEGSTQLNISIGGGTGDADLYVKYGSRPTVSSFDCRPYFGSSTETCSFPTPGAGTYYVMVRGYWTYSGVSLVANWNELQNNVTVSNLYGGWGTEKRYTFYVPPNTPSVTFQLMGGTGDADLYVRYNAQPTVSLFDCRPYSGGSTETCTFNAPAAGTYHVMVRGFTTYSGVPLVAKM